MKKKVYESPIAEVIHFQEEEILTNGGDNSTTWPGWDQGMEGPGME